MEPYNPNPTTKMRLFTENLQGQTAVLRAPLQRRHVANATPAAPRTSHPQLESSAEILTRKAGCATAPSSFGFTWGKQSPTVHRVVGLQDDPVPAAAPSAALTELL